MPMHTVSFMMRRDPARVDNGGVTLHVASTRSIDLFTVWYGRKAFQVTRADLRLLSRRIDQALAYRSQCGEDVS